MIIGMVQLGARGVHATASWIKTSSHNYRRILTYQCEYVNTTRKLPPAKNVQFSQFSQTTEMYSKHSFFGPTIK